MYTTYFVIAAIALVFVVAIQLIRMNIYVMKIKKSKELNTVEIKEDNNWEFIKGLY
jgi:hypothetical protein